MRYSLTEISHFVTSISALFGCNLSFDGDEMKFVN